MLRNKTAGFDRKTSAREIVRHLVYTSYTAQVIHQTPEQALEEIRDIFRNVRSEGPFQVAYFLAPEDERLRERIQGEAYAVSRTFFDGLEK
jgi:hypothetical protein